MLTFGGMEFDDYETLPTSSTSTHMVAGAFAGIMEHCVMYPIDSVKTRMQSLNPNPKAKYRNISEALLKMIRHEGVLRPVRGMSAVVIGAGPAHALYFSCYEKMKRILTGNELGTGHPLTYAAAGALSTLLHDAIMNPADVVKQRMQVYNSPYRTCSDCFCKVLKAEGACAFYRSYTTQLVMNVPFQSIHFMTYEFCQELTNHERTYNPMAHMISGAISGAFAAAVTTPLDVCKTLLNTQEQQALHLSKQPHINGLIEAATTVYRFSGLRGYFQGLQARVLFQFPATGIAWSVYEFFKYTLSLNKSNYNYKQEHGTLISHANSIDDQHSTKSITALPVVYSK